MLFCNSFVLSSFLRLSCFFSQDVLTWNGLLFANWWNLSSYTLHWRLRYLPFLSPHFSSRSDTYRNHRLLFGLWRFLLFHCRILSRFLVFGFHCSGYSQKLNTANFWPYFGVCLWANRSIKYWWRVCSLLTSWTISDIPFTCNSETLIEFFSACGDVIDANVWCYLLLTLQDFV